MTRFSLLAVCGLLAMPAWGGEFVLFVSGQRMYWDRHEQRGDRILLYRGESVAEIPARSVVGFEAAEGMNTAEAAPLVAAAPEPAPVAAPQAPVEAAKSNDPRTLVREAAVRAGLPPEFVESVALVESAFRPEAISSKGAIGVMQLMPDTARSLGADPYDMQQNIDAGTRLLRDLLNKYGGDVHKALAAYNAGEGAVERYQGIPPYDETRRYVNKVIGAYQEAGGR